MYFNFLFELSTQQRILKKIFQNIAILTVFIKVNAALVSKKTYFKSYWPQSFVW